MDTMSLNEKILYEVCKLHRHAYKVMLLFFNKNSNIISLGT